jgi:ABC-type Zn uptake system ZnuABC Zn-binding protein ZnuA
MRRILVVLILCCVFFSGCSFFKQDKIDVVVSIPSLVEIVKKVGGNKVNVYSIVLEGANPENDFINEEDLLMIEDSDLVFLIGDLKIEKEIRGIAKSKTNTEIISLAQNLKEDNYYWLSPKKMNKTVDIIYTKLSEKDSRNSDYYKKNSKNYIKLVEELERHIVKLLPVRTDINVYFYESEKWQTFSKDYVIIA